MKLIAQQAELSKLPGDWSDYRVLRYCPGPLGPSQFEGIIRRLAVADPTAEQARLSPPPWATFGSVRVGTINWMAMVAHMRTGAADSGGRPIVAARCFCLPLDDVIAARAHYHAIYRGLLAAQGGLEASTPTPLAAPPMPQPHAIETPPWERSTVDLGTLPPWERTAPSPTPTQDDVRCDPLELDVHSPDPKDVARLVDSVGFEFVATIAGLLLDRPVAIVPSASFDVEDRLQSLDAVMALLPFGLRCATDVSTWADGDLEHSVRLAFSARSRIGGERTLIAWRDTDAAKAALRSGLGPEYVSALDVLRRHLKTEGLVELLRSCVELDANPRSSALSIVRRHALPYEILEEVRGRRGPVPPALGADIRKVFEDQSANDLLAEEKLELAEALVASRIRVSPEFFRSHWVPGSGRALGRTAVDLASGDRAAAQFDSFAVVASEFRELDAFLQCSLPLVAGDPTLRRSAVALLLARHETLTDDLLAVVTSSPPLMYELLHQDTAHAADLIRSLSAANTTLDSVLAPYAIALGMDEWLAANTTSADLEDEPSGRNRQKRIVKNEDIARLAQQAPEYVLDLTRVADDAKRLELVFPAVWSWLVGVLDGAGAWQYELFSGWMQLFRDLATRDQLGDELLALLDVFLLWQERRSPDRAFDWKSKAYCEHFGSALQRPEVSYGMRREVIVTLRDLLANGGWRSTDVAPRALYLLEVLDRGFGANGPTMLRAEIQEAVLTGLEQDFALVETPEMAYWLSHLPTVPTVEARVEWVRLHRDIEVGSGLDLVAARGARILALTRGEDAARLVTLLARATELVSTSDAAVTLSTAIREHLDGLGVTTELRCASELAFHQAVIEGHPQSEIVDKYVNWLRQQSMNELNRSSQTLALVYKLKGLTLSERRNVRNVLSNLVLPADPPR